MNNFTIIGKFKTYFSIDKENIVLLIETSSPFHKNVILSIITKKELNIEKIKENDLVGIKGFIDVNNKTVNLIASKITWLSQ